MVAANPLLSGKWSIKKFNATVINDIWPETLFFTIVAAVVTIVSKKVHDLGFANSLLTVLGTVLGLVISFRTSSAYERYQDGRKLWTSITLASRNLGQYLWIHIAVDRPDKSKSDGDANKDANKDAPKDARLKAVIEKKSMINLVQAFSVSVKHYLRAEPGIYYEDLYPLVSFLPRHSSQPAFEHTAHDILPMWSDHDQLSQTARSSPRSTPATTISSKSSKRRKDNFDPEKALPQVESEVPLRGARNPPKATVYDYIPLLLLFKPVISGPHRLYRLIFKKRDEDELAPAGTRGLMGKKHPPPPVDSNVPLEITLFLSTYTQYLLKQGLLQPAIASAVVSNIASLQDAVTNLERIRSTPIPFAYQAHLRMSLWIYLFFLPFQIYAQMGYLTIPARCFAAFLLLGFLEIGQEIENPFNYDENDLDMDSFCFSIQRELHEITAHPAPDPHTYIFSSHNQPFAPTDRRTAEAMVLDLNHEYHGHKEGMDHIRRTMLKNWREVEEVTRHV